MVANNWTSYKDILSQAFVKEKKHGYEMLCKNRVKSFSPIIIQKIFQFFTPEEHYKDISKPWA